MFNSFVQQEGHIIKTKSKVKYNEELNLYYLTSDFAIAKISDEISLYKKINEDTYVFERKELKDVLRKRGVVNG